MLGIKRRYWLILALIGMIALSVVPGLSPVRPFIQLPGEVYPGTETSGALANWFPGWTNTFSASLLAWAVVLAIGLGVRAGSRSADEVPTGFYNFFEMVIEGAYNFAANIAGKNVRDFFPFFMTYILIILTSNWLGLFPGFDSIGLWEPKPVFYMHKEEKVIKNEFKALYAAGDKEAFDAYQAEIEGLYGIELEFEEKGAISESSIKYLEAALVAAIDLENRGDMRTGAAPDSCGNKYDLQGCGLWLTRASETTEVVDGIEVTSKPDAADWTIVPFFRPAATDLNMTLAFAIIAMVAVQYMGIKHLGARDYFSKFFPFIGKGWSQQVAKNPVKAIDPIVGLLELVSEISKVISFAFRLLGNIFAGMVLLFVMAFLLPAANLAFFGLEFFVGLIQALVFGLLMLIFMVSATEHHGDHDHDDDHH